MFAEFLERRLRKPDFAEACAKLQERHPQAAADIICAVVGLSRLMKSYDMDVRLMSEQDLDGNEISSTIDIAGWIEPIAFDIGLDVLTRGVSLEIQSGAGLHYEIVEYLDNPSIADIEERLAFLRSRGWDPAAAEKGAWPFGKERP